MEGTGTRSHCGTKNNCVRKEDNSKACVTAGEVEEGRASEHDGGRGWRKVEQVVCKEPMRRQMLINRSPNMGRADRH